MASNCAQTKGSRPRMPRFSYEWPVRETLPLLPKDKYRLSAQNKKTCVSPASYGEATAPGNPCIDAVIPRIAACAQRGTCTYETDRLYGLLITRPVVPRRPRRRLIDHSGHLGRVRDIQEPFDEGGAATRRTRLGRDGAR